MHNSPADTPAVHRRVDPAHDRRRLVLYFGGLIVFYVAVVLVARPHWNGGEDELKGMAFGVMLAPTVGAALATVLGPGVIRFGKPSRWILAGFAPALFVLGVTAVAAVAGGVDADWGRLGVVLALLVPQALLGSISALGEEIGWRGFLWPLLRRRMAFPAASAVMFAIWWLYHAPLVVAGLYGTRSGLPAFTVAIAGFVLFAGVVTERSRSIWPSVIAHGAWNAYVATAFAATGDDAMFSGSDTLLGEFGWIAAGSMIVLGAAAAGWHMRTPTRDGLPSRAPMGYDGAVQWRAFGSTPAQPTAG